jgi:alpha-mannosidase
MALAPKAPPKADLAELDRLWKLVLLNQFHDVLPGSSIGWVYKDAEAHYAEVARAGEALRQTYLGQWGAAMDSHTATRPSVVANTCNWQRTDLVTLPREGSYAARAALASGKSMPVQAVEDERGNPAWLTQVTVPSMGAAVVDRVEDAASPPKDFQPVTVTGRTLENRFLKVTIDELGQVERIFDKEANREVLHDGRPANRLCLYVDRPITYDAWDVDAYYLEREPRGAEVESIEATEQGPIRATIEVKLTLGKASTAIQRIRLAAGSRRIDFDTEVDWHERDTLLRALFPVRVLSDQATYEIQFGHVRRPNHFNTSWDMARFEVCAQKWMDLSEADYGVALMNDCKYGHSCHGDTMGISLLRSPTTPDPEADQGAHRFTYSLYPHPGDLRKAEVIRRAYELNAPLLATDIEPRKGSRGRRWCGLGVEGRGVVVESVKPAENPADGRVIVRAYESHGGRGSARLTCGVPFKDAVAVTPLEEPTERYAVTQEGNDVRLDFSPFAIRSVALWRE